MTHLLDTNICSAHMRRPGGGDLTVERCGGEGGFRWKVASADGQAVRVITAARPVGVMYGVCLLLVRLSICGTGRRQCWAKRCRNRRACRPPLIVGRQPHCLVAAGQDLPVACVVVSGQPVGSCVLRYHQLGAARWTDVAMPNSFRRTYTAAIPGADLKQEHVGVEWYVSAIGPSNRPAFWPKGYPSVVWSASIVPQAERKITTGRNIVSSSSVPGKYLAVTMPHGKAGEKPQPRLRFVSRRNRKSFSQEQVLCPPRWFLA